jgi:hypothetical protein
MAKKPMTVADSLREHASRASGARWEEALSEVTDLEEQKDAAEQTADALEELDGVQDSLGTLSASLETLSAYGLVSSIAFDYVSEANSNVEQAMDVVAPDDLRGFVEAYEEATQALESYGDTKDQDPFPGKREEVEEAWGEATTALETLADAYDQIDVGTTLGEAPGAAESASGDQTPIEAAIATVTAEQSAPETSQ